MAVCMDDVLENALAEQNDEVVVLESIYGENFHLIEHDDVEQKLRQIEFNLRLTVRHPYEKILVEAVIPVDAPEPRPSSTNSDESGENGESLTNNFENVNDVGEDVVGEDVVGEFEGRASGSSFKEPSGQRQKKPGLSRLLSTKHWYIESEVSELTPINLFCRFPLFYPTKFPPDFTIYCDWLSDSQIKVLSDVLRELWEKNDNVPVVFTWAEWLQNSSWDLLGLSSHLVLKEGFKENLSSQETNAFNYGINDSMLELAVLNIFEYDMEINRQEFFNSQHTCEVCLEDKEGREFCFLDGCHHFCCLDCLKLHCESHINSGTVTRLMCPTHDCNETIPPQVLQNILDEEKYKRWEHLLLSRTLDMMRDVYYCPRCNNVVVADEDESSRLAQCATCFYSFCTECQGPWHAGQSCEGEEEVQEVEKKKKKKKAHKGGEDKEESDEVEEEEPSKAARKLRRSQFMSSKNFILAMKSKGMFRNCPNCKMVIEKTEGCNFMTCSQCRGHFCWVCAHAITSYSHFDSSPKCRIIIMPEDVVPVKPPSEGELLIAAFKKKNPGKRVRLKKCPTCAQENIKELNNNHLKCWSCKKHYCYQCGKKIEGGFKHFKSPNLCTQHSDD